MPPKDTQIDSSPNSCHESHMPTSVRLGESDEERYRHLAELQKIPLAEWIRRALQVRADTIEKWIEADRFIDAGEKGYIYLDELPPKQADKLTNRKKP